MTQIELVGKLLLAYGEGAFTLEQFQAARGVRGLPVDHKLRLERFTRMGLFDSLRPREYRLTPKALERFQKGE